jgi:AraC family ethanolamine operon transcriptional activator
MLVFDDFDAWGEAISGASLRLACDSVETSTWTLGIADLGEVVLQVASEGGGNICYGANTHAGPILFVPLSHATEHVVNGEPLDRDSLLAIPPGADFRIRVRRCAHSWCSIALPQEAASQPFWPATSERMVCRPNTLPWLTRMVSTIAATLLTRPPAAAAHAAAGRDLLAAANACLRDTRPPRSAIGRPRMDRAAIVRRAMDSIDAAVTAPTAAELALAVGVTSRTLLRIFKEEFGMPPKKYLMLRELHAVRRALHDDSATNRTVADVLVRHGIWEFGRFASRYRRQFGESPSQTLRRARY